MKTKQRKQRKPRQRRTNDPYQLRNQYLQTMGFKTYSAYLASPLWKGIRANAYAKHGRQCLVCKETAVVMHHTDYSPDTLEGRTLRGLVPLCNECHQKIEFTDKGSKRCLQDANEWLMYLRGLADEPRVRRKGEPRKANTPDLRICNYPGCWKYGENNGRCDQHRHHHVPSVSREEHVKEIKQQIANNKKRREEETGIPAWFIESAMSCLQSMGRVIELPSGAIIPRKNIRYRLESIGNSREEVQQLIALFNEECISLCSREVCKRAEKLARLDRGIKACKEWIKRLG